MKNIILFDADSQHYRQSIYKYFNSKFREYGYNLVVVYDKRLTSIDHELFVGIKYSFSNFRKMIKHYNCKLIISFVWLRYKFLLPFLVYCRINRIKIVVWSHGINLQKKRQIVKNQFYYIRQRLANALIIFSKDQLKYIVANKKKIFIANNTLNFHDFTKVELSKKALKQKYNLKEKNVILCVGRMNTNNRKPEHLIKLAQKLDSDFHVLLIGPGVSEVYIDEIRKITTIEYLGVIYDQDIINEYYKMADVFIMPGAIGLAINQAFYFETPCIVENVGQGPEAYYLREGFNGYYYKPGDINELYAKLNVILDEQNHTYFCENARETIVNEGSIENMFSGFWEAIKYVEKSNY